MSPGRGGHSRSHVTPFFTLNAIMHISIRYNISHCSLPCYPYVCVLCVSVCTLCTLCVLCVSVSLCVLCVSVSFATELAAVNAQHPFEPLQFLDPALRITFAEGIAMLREVRCASLSLAIRPSQHCTDIAPILCLL